MQPISKNISLITILSSSLLLVACSQESSSAPEQKSEAQISTAADHAPKAETTRKVTSETLTIAKGEFSGRSDHITSGTVKIVKSSSGFKLVLSDDFSLDGAPDPTLAFGNGNYVETSNFSALKQIKGEQTYDLPAELDPTIYSQVYVWCKKFSVPLGVAELEIVEDINGLDDTYGS